MAGSFQRTVTGKILLVRKYDFDKGHAYLSSLRLFARISQIIQEDIERNDNINQHIEKKLQQKIEEKKLAQGQKISDL